MIVTLAGYMLVPDRVVTRINHILIYTHRRTRRL
jgi:hypothetical protein